jgi:hypothetical protein
MSASGIEVAAVGLVRVMLWAVEREALAAIRRAADAFEVIVRRGPRFSRAVDGLDD